MKDTFLHECTHDCIRCRGYWDCPYRVEQERGIDHEKVQSNDKH